MNRLARLALSLIVGVAAFVIPAKSEPPPTQILSVSLPALRLAAGERVVGFQVDVTSGRIAQLSSVPIGWNISVETDPSWNTKLDASVIVAAAALDPSFFKNFIEVEKHESPRGAFGLTGEITVSTDFSSTRIIPVAMKDFTFEVRDYRQGAP